MVPANPGGQLMVVFQHAPRPAALFDRINFASGVYHELQPSSCIWPRHAGCGSCRQRRSCRLSARRRLRSPHVARATGCVGANSKAVAYDRRGCGETRAEKEDFSAVADLMAVIDAAADGKTAILVGCSEGGRIALDAVLKHPSCFRGLVLIAPSVSGAPEAAYPPEIKDVMAQLKEAQATGDLDQMIAIKARLWLDGPLAPEGRVTGRARELFHDMNAMALRLPPAGSNIDLAPAYQRLGEILAPSLIIQGDLDFPHIQERSRHIAMTVLNGSHHELAGAAHLPNLDPVCEG